MSFLKYLIPAMMLFVAIAIPICLRRNPLPPTDEEVLERDLLKLRTADKMDFEAIAQQLERKWHDRSPEVYGKILLAIRDRRPCATPEDDIRAQRFSMRVLENDRKIPVHVQVELVSGLRVTSAILPKDHPTPKDLEADRRRKTAVTIAVLEALTAAIDPAFPADPKYRHEVDVTMPCRQWEPTWVSNARQQGPREGNCQPSRIYYEQVLLRQDTPEFIDRSAELLAGLYPDTADQTELRDLVNRSSLPPPLKARLLPPWHAK